MMVVGVMFTTGVVSAPVFGLKINQTKTNTTRDFVDTKNADDLVRLHVAIGLSEGYTRQCSYGNIIHHGYLEGDYSADIDIIYSKFYVDEELHPKRIEGTVYADIFVTNLETKEKTIFLDYYNEFDYKSKETPPSGLDEVVTKDLPFGPYQVTYSFDIVVWIYDKDNEHEDGYDVHGYGSKNKTVPFLQLLSQNQLLTRILQIILKNC